MSFRIHILILFLLLPCIAFSVQPDEMLADKHLEARARAISAGLRCLVCQNQSIDDSDADLAHDLRLLVRQRLQEGDSDAQVRQYIVMRYGNYVLLNPPFTGSTLILWLSPLFFLGAGIMCVGLVFYKHKKSRLPDTKPLSAEEKLQLAILLDGEEK
jgi:cytochrome c-type biogenesis protein CcmH